jgi:2-succinyl-6-hydroxy-2,4-cyclohexadiene-1-carboxylate synthase
MITMETGDGTRYSVTAVGEGPPVLLLHGFTGRGASWAMHLSALARTNRVILVDLLGHGAADSPPAARHAVEHQAADLAAILDRLGAAPADVAGYSFGARIALRLAIDAPASVRRLILESPSAGIADPEERAARRISDQRWVDQLLAGDIDGFVRDWATQPVFASQAGLPSAVRDALAAERRSNDPRGLAASLLGAGQGVMTPMHDRLGSIVMPTLVVSGRLDPRGMERASEVAAAITGARLRVIDDAGHRPDLETATRFRELVTEFLATPVAVSTPALAT